MSNRYHVPARPGTDAAMAAMIRRIAREEWSQLARQVEVTGYVTGLSPLTVRLRNGDTIRVERQVVGAKPAEGQRVAVQRNGVHWVLLGPTEVGGAQTGGGGGDHPDADHADTFSQLGHTHPYAPEGHGHGAADITSGVLDAARVPPGAIQLDREVEDGSGNYLVLDVPAGETYRDLLVVAHGRHKGSGLANMHVILNGDTGGNYLASTLQVTQGGTFGGFHSLGQFGGWFAKAGSVMTAVVLWITGAHGAHANVSGTLQVSASSGTTSATNEFRYEGVRWANSGPVSNVWLYLPNSELWAAGSTATLFGLGA